MYQDANDQTGAVVPRSLIQARTSEIDFAYRTVVVIISVGPCVNRSTTIYINQVPPSSCLLVKPLVKFLKLRGLLVLASIGRTVPLPFDLSP